MDEATITLERADKFLSHVYWKDCNLVSKLLTRKNPIQVSTLDCGLTRPPFAEVKDKLFTPTHIGASFGPSWATHWFRIVGTIPDEWKGACIVLRWDAEAECCVYDPTGLALQGLTGGQGGDKRHEFIVTHHSHGGEHVELFIEMACNGMFGVGDGGMIQPPNPSRRFTLQTAELAVLELDAWCLYWDLETLLHIAQESPATSEIRARAVAALEAMLACVDVGDKGSWLRARTIAGALLRRRRGDGAGGGGHLVTAVGHCHIDTAWLWPYAETRRKVARSWSTALRLMEQYRGFVFAASQAQQFAWLARDHPRLTSQLKAMAAREQFVPVGGTWVEMDCNLPSGESLARQFLMGQRYFRTEFGVFCDVFWLPDTFGYSAQLPQIMRLAGIDFFLTQKLSWSLVNKPPRSTFAWEGLDGSAVLVHFPPADTYNSSASVADVIKSRDANKDKDRFNESLLLYGHGDGGGGPTPAMLERLHRLCDVPGLPRVRTGSPLDLARRLREVAAASPLRRWRGELYLELHQGTFTSQAFVKWSNRRCEELLMETEATAALAALLTRASRDSSSTGGVG
eukprot:CAMPEP_0196773040 /NCGR_PEP_ID=MMETSP1104-20130614/2552_1 /TAXON_ID=33652 /ORGANISM="Cafeteria sp., Strain Caron Lab Isolate" /LENGTH=569 /DNA_ID=CAMNT_0042143183 /DNA_START=1 /DNA_END=1707 /DNA_ORIENTATION=+